MTFSEGSLAWCWARINSGGMCELWPSSAGKGMCEMEFSHPPVGS